MSNNTFKKVGSSDQKMYGPRKILVCGYPPEDQEIVLSFFRDHGLGDFPVLFVPEVEEDKCLGELVDRPHLFGYRADPGKTRAVILSGFTERELQRLLAAYRNGKIPRPLLATLTPTSKTWTVRFLLGELRRESEEMRRLQQERALKKTVRPAKES